tara:strand:+ start:169 stop:741 length:573 start_codon:yes stop_codon:yes gene_type:complete
MITAIGDVMREAYKRNWITTRDGNCSLKRKGKDVLYITPSGVRKNIIYPETVVRLPILNGELLYSKKASAELEMHWLLQNSHKGTRSVLHLHPTYTIAAMMAGHDLQALAAEFPEIYRYTKVAQNVPVLPATSPELAKHTFNKMTSDGKIKFDVVGQAQHGVCAIGKNPWEAFEHIERLEHICKIALAAR